MNLLMTARLWSCAAHPCSYAKRAAPFETTVDAVMPPMRIRVDSFANLTL